jgi:transposase-like protein
MTKKHRTYSPEFKAQAVLAVLSGSKTAAELCREHQIKPDLLSKWKAAFLDNGSPNATVGWIPTATSRVGVMVPLTLELEVAKASTLLRPSRAKEAGLISWCMTGML